MKLLYVYSDDDYGALTFEQSELGQKSYKEVSMKVNFDNLYFPENPDDRMVQEAVDLIKGRV